MKEGMRMKNQKRKAQYILFAMVVCCAMLIVSDVILEKKANREYDEKLAAYDTINPYASGAAVSTSDTGTEVYEPGIQWEFEDGYNLENLNISLDELNQLNVYELEYPEDTKEELAKVAEYFIGTSADKLIFNKEKLPAGDGYLGGYEYSYKKEEDNLERHARGQSMTCFTYGCDGQMTSGENKIDDVENYVNQCREQLRLGIWDGDTPLSEIKKRGVSDYEIEDVFDYGISCTEWLYQNTEDRKLYSGNQSMTFHLTTAMELEYADYLSQYKVKEKRKLSHSYNSVQELEEIVEKAKKRLEVKLQNQNNGAYNPLFETYYINEARIRYCYIDWKKSQDGHKAVVPILELTGKLDTVWITDQNTTTCQVAVGVNLDTGEFMNYTTSAMGK
jgi:hypothetical protein